MKMAGLPMPRGTWLILVIAVIPVLVSQVASAAPGYPVADPPGTAHIVAYDSPSHVLTLTSSTVDTIEESSAARDTAADAAISESTTSGVVAGPDGQINHGQVMKQLHELTEGRNSGCLTSAVAQSDLGKGDQEEVAGEIDWTTVEVDCTTSDGSGRSDEAQGRSDEAQGRSDEAQGRSDKAAGKGK